MPTIKVYVSRLTLHYWLKGELKFGPVYFDTFTDAVEMMIPFNELLMVGEMKDRMYWKPKAKRKRTK